MGTLERIIQKYSLDLSKRSPFQLSLNREFDIPALYAELGFTVGAEIGVFDGLNSERLCRGNPNLHLYCVDAWTEYPTHRNFRRQGHLDSAYMSALRRLAPYNCTIVKKWSMDAVKDFEDESLDFVYIDGNHNFEFVTNDIAEWRKKVRVGGIVSGHDYGRGRDPEFGHVKDVVSAWAYSHRIHPWFIIDSPTVPGDTGWMWVKI